MPGYITKALMHFQHPPPAQIQNSPHKHILPTYGATVQFTLPEVQSPLLDTADKKYVQAVTGTLLYYARAVDSTILTALKRGRNNHLPA